MLAALVVALRSLALCLLKIAYGLRPLMFGASLDTLRADDFRPGLAVLVAPKLSSVARRTAA
jgi:hypothetical protein